MKKRTLLISGILLLLLAGLKWARHLSQYMDVTFGDEAQYLRYGLDLFQTIKKDWGPSYNLWYKFLSFFQSNPVSLFYLNYQVTAIVLAVLLFVFLMRYNISFFISIWLSFCFLLSPTVIDTWPRVSHFAVIVLLMFLIAVRNIELKSRKMILMSLAFYFAAYARPELFFSFILISIATTYFLFRERTDIKRWMPLFLIVLCIVVINFLMYHLPADSYKGINRTYIAFSQHYAINYVLEHKAHFNPISEWIDFARYTFGNCTDFSCILKTHPDLVIHNSLLNLKNYAFTLLQFLISILFPVKIIGKKIVQLLIFTGLLGVVLFVFLNKDSRNNLIKQIRQHQLLLLILFLFGLPSIGTSVLIFPRQHYLLMHSILLIFMVTILINSISLFQNIKPIFVLFLFIPFLIKAPTAIKYNYNQVEKDNKNHCNTNLVQYITAKNDKKMHVIFSNHLSLSMLLPGNFSDFNTEYEYKPGMQFKNILLEKKIDYIVIRDILLHEKLLNSDTTWINFMKDPAIYHFNKEIYCDSCESYLLVKSEE